MRTDHSEKEIQESHAFLYVKTENEVYANIDPVMCNLLNTFYIDLYGVLLQKWIIVPFQHSTL